METKLSKRLETVADFVPQGARLVDVGSDHAYLPLFLVEQKRIDLPLLVRSFKVPTSQHSRMLSWQVGLI